MNVIEYYKPWDEKQGVYFIWGSFFDIIRLKYVPLNLIFLLKNKEFHGMPILLNAINWYIKAKNGMLVFTAVYTPLPKYIWQADVFKCMHFPITTTRDMNNICNLVSPNTDRCVHYSSAETSIATETNSKNINRSVFLGVKLKIFGMWFIICLRGRWKCSKTNSHSHVLSA